jgi:hypothetical protein
LQVPDRVNEDSEENAALRPGIERKTENMTAEIFIVKLYGMK